MINPGAEDLVVDNGVRKKTDGKEKTKKGEKST